MLGLSNLGIFHTVVGLFALTCGCFLLARDKEITTGTRLGRIYVAATLITAVTALGIFRRGGFGPPHVLAILTLIALLVGRIAETTSAFGASSAAVRTSCYSATILFHIVPGLTETTTRFPRAKPLIDSPESPILLSIGGVLLVLLVLGVRLQLRRQRALSARV